MVQVSSHLHPPLLLTQLLIQRSTPRPTVEQKVEPTSPALLQTQLQDSPDGTGGHWAPREGALLRMMLLRLLLHRLLLQLPLLLLLQLLQLYRES